MAKAKAGKSSFNGNLRVGLAQLLLYWWSRFSEESERNKSILAIQLLSKFGFSHSTLKIVHFLPSGGFRQWFC
jgi:hypothetical protein